MRARCGAYLVVRTLHTLITLGITATLIVKKTDLSDTIRRWPDVNAIAYSLGFLVLVGLSLCMYFTTCLVEPGFVPLPSKRHTWNSNSDEEDLMSESTTMLVDEEEGRVTNSNQGIKLRRCGYCEIEQPLRSHHCEDCSRCVRRYDHHCPWLETCIGERNHKYFWFFLLSCSALLVWAFGIVWRAFIYNVYWSEWFSSNMFFIIDFCILFSGGFTLIGLLCFHTYLMCSSQTTWEVMSRERITYLKNLREDLNPFNEGYCRNMYTFLCSMSTRRWDMLYKRYASFRN